MNNDNFKRIHSFNANGPLQIKNTHVVACAAAAQSMSR